VSSSETPAIQLAELLVNLLNDCDPLDSPTPDAFVPTTDLLKVLRLLILNNPTDSASFTRAKEDFIR
jgi:hypothetical protein